MVGFTGRSPVEKLDLPQKLRGKSENDSTRSDDAKMRSSI